MNIKLPYASLLVVVIAFSSSAEAVRRTGSRGSAQPRPVARVEDELRERAQRHVDVIPQDEINLFNAALEQRPPIPLLPPSRVVADNRLAAVSAPVLPRPLSFVPRFVTEVSSWFAHYLGVVTNDAPVLTLLQYAYGAGESIQSPEALERVYSEIPDEHIHESLWSQEADRVYEDATISTHLAHFRGVRVQRQGSWMLRHILHSSDFDFAAAGDLLTHNANVERNLERLVLLVSDFMTAELFFRRALHAYLESMVDMGVTVAEFEPMVPHFNAEISTSYWREAAWQRLYHVALYRPTLLEAQLTYMSLYRILVTLRETLFHPVTRAEMARAVVVREIPIGRRFNYNPNQMLISFTHAAHDQLALAVYQVMQMFRPEALEAQMLLHLDTLEPNPLSDAIAMEQRTQEYRARALLDRVAPLVWMSRASWRQAPASSAVHGAMSLLITTQLPPTLRARDRRAARRMEQRQLLAATTASSATLEEIVDDSKEAAAADVSATTRAAMTTITTSSRGSGGTISFYDNLQSARARARDAVRSSSNASAALAAIVAEMRESFGSNRVYQLVNEEQWMQLLKSLNNKYQQMLRALFEGANLEYTHQQVLNLVHQLAGIMRDTLRMDAHTVKAFVDAVTRHIHPSHSPDFGKRMLQGYVDKLMSEFIVFGMFPRNPSTEARSPDALRLFEQRQREFQFLLKKYESKHAKK